MSDEEVVAAAPEKKKRKPRSRAADRAIRERRREEARAAREATPRDPLRHAGGYNAASLATANKAVLSRAELIREIQTKIRSALDHLTDEKIAEMKGRDIAITLGILIEKQELLQGRPTAILEFQERQKLPELTRQWMIEAKKRGLTIDETAVEVVEEVRPRAFMPVDRGVDQTARRMGIEPIREIPDE